MSALDDARTLIQDIVVPDLKALTARVEALEQTMKQRFDSVEKLAEVRHDWLVLRMESGFAAAEAKSDIRFAALDSKIDSKFAAMEARLSAMDAKSAAEFAAIEARFAAADARFDAILKAIDIDRRLELLEAAQARLPAGEERHA